jgi:hypothetical protein
MFVDDLQTFSTNVENTITQLTVINTFVEETDSIINTKKSSISTSTDIHLLKNILQKKGVPIKTTSHYVHLGAAYALAQLEHQNQMQTSADVNRRVGIAKSTLTTMIHNGLRRGAIDTNPAIHIIQSILLHQLLSGLTHATLTKADRTALDHTMANAARAIFGIDRKQLIHDRWLLRDTGITSPTDHLYVRDVKLYLDTLAGRLNPVVTNVILHNFPSFTKSCEKSLAKWHITIDEARSIPKKDITKNLQSRAQSIPLTLGNPLAIQTTQDTLQVNTKEKAYTTMQVPPHLLPTFLETRAFLHQGNMTQNDICPFCPNGVNHTYLHCINDCILNKGTKSSQTNPHFIAPTITYPMLIHVLGGESCDDVKQEDCRNIMVHALTMIHNSPILTPRTELD